MCNGFFFIIYRVVPLSPQCTWRIFPSSPKESPVLECGQSPPHPHCPASTNLLPASLDLPVLKFKWARIITCVVVFLWPLKTINRVTFFWRLIQLMLFFFLIDLFKSFLLMWYIWWVVWDTLFVYGGGVNRISGGLGGKESACLQETHVWSLGGEYPLEKWQPTPVFLPGEFHG